MKIKHIITLDGKSIDTATLPKEERVAIFHEMNVDFMKKHGYVKMDTQETA